MKVVWGGVLLLVAGGLGCSPSPGGASGVEDGGGANTVDGGGSSGGGASSGSSSSSGAGSSSSASSSSSGASSSSGTSSSSGASSSSGNTSSSGGTSSSSSGGVTCENLDEWVCRQHTECEVAPSCCAGAPNECTRIGIPPPCPFVCPPVSCTGLGEDLCRHTEGCVADYCHQCSCDGLFEGCRAASEPETQCPLLGCPQPLCVCGDLDERGCLAERGTCKAHSCELCGPDPAFNACVGPNEDPGCPRPPCPATCSADGDCQGPVESYCVPPGGPPACGGPCQIPPSTCTADADCAFGDICVPAPCSCNGEMVCQNGCSAANPCPEGQGCMPGGHCEPQACGTMSCDWNFICNQAQQRCERRPCSSDEVCRGGACVLGSCYNQPGTCQQALP